MKHKKYILQVMGMNSNKYGGLEQFMVLLAEELNKYGFGLILMYNNYPNSEIYINKINELNVKLIVINRVNHLRFFIYYTRVLFKYRPMVIHSHFDPFLAVIYAKLFGFKNRIITNHMMIIDNHFKEVTDIKLIRLRARIYQKLLNYSSDKFLAVSYAVQKQFTKLYPETASKSEVLHLGTCQNAFTKSKTREHFHFSNDLIYIVSVAFSHHMKGIDNLIEAAKILKEIDRLKNFLICIIGLDESLPYTNELKQLAATYNLDNNIIWFGIRDDVPELLSAMDIYCQPSRTESMGFSIFEAGMAGLPCIGSNVGGIPEAILANETGFLYNVEDAPALARCLKVLLLNNNLRLKMGIKSREHILRNFKIEEQVKKQVQLYLKLSDYKNLTS